MPQYDCSLVRRQDRLLPHSKAIELLRNGEYGVLSLQLPQGGGYGIPLNFAWDEEETLFFHGAPTGRKLEAIEACNRATFTIVGNTKLQPEKFTTYYESILLEGTIAIISDPSTQHKALLRLIEKYAPTTTALSEKQIEKFLHRTRLFAFTIIRWSGKSKAENKNSGSTSQSRNNII